MHHSQPIREPERPSSSRRCKTMRRTMATSPLGSNREYMSSTARLAPAKASWEELSQAIHDFSRVCFLDETTPDLLNDFTRLERCYQNFQRQARTIFNNTRPSRSNVSIRPTSAIDKTCVEMIKLFNAFMATFQQCHVDGLGPLYRLMGDRFIFLAQMLQAFSVIYSEPQPLVAIGAVRKVQAVIDDLRVKSEQLAATVHLYDEASFDTEMFTEYLNWLNEGVRYLFSNVIPKNSVNIGSIVGNKRELFIACDELLRMFDGVQQFYSIWGSVNVLIAGVTETFNALFSMLNLPRRLEFVDIDADGESTLNPGSPVSTRGSPTSTRGSPATERGSPITERGSPRVERESPNKEAEETVERIRCHICEIEAALLDATNRLKK